MKKTIQKVIQKVIQKAMKKPALILVFAALILCVVGCGGGSSTPGIPTPSPGAKYKVVIKLQTPAKNSKLKTMLDPFSIPQNGQYATYVTCQDGTLFNGGYACGLNQRVALFVTIEDSNGNPITVNDPNSIQWQNPDTTNIYFWGNPETTTPSTGEAADLSIRKEGKYNISATYQGYSGSCQVIAFNSIYCGTASQYDSSMTDYQGIIFNSDSSFTQTNNTAIADFYIDYADSGMYTTIVIAPNGMAEVLTETWDFPDQYFLTQYSPIETVPSNLTYTNQVTLSNVSAQIFIVKTGNGGYAKVATTTGGGTLIGLVYSVTSPGTTTFPLSY